MIGDILQPTHLLFILVVALLVLGPKRLPEVGKSLGRGLRDFKVALSGEEDDAVLGHTSADTTTVSPEDVHPATVTPTPVEAKPPQPAVTPTPVEATPPAEHSA